MDFEDKAYMLHVFLTVDYKGNPDVPNEAAFRWGVKADGGKFPGQYINMQGLRSKYFGLMLDDNGAGKPNNDMCMGFYAFKTKADLDAYLETDLWKMQSQASKGPFKQFAKAEYKIHEVMPGTEKTMDLSQWAGKK